MSVDPSAGPDGRVPRHVWALLLVIVVVLGFAVGGTVRSALRPIPQAGPQRATAVPAAAVRDDRQLAGRPAGRSERHRCSDRDARACGGSTRDPALRGSPGQGAPGGIRYRPAHRLPAVVHAPVGHRRRRDDHPRLPRHRPPGLAAGRHLPRLLESRLDRVTEVRRDVRLDGALRARPRALHRLPQHPALDESGRPIQSESSLGAPIGHGGCVRQRAVDAKWLYWWASIGTTVVRSSRCRWAARLRAARANTDAQGSLAPTQSSSCAWWAPSSRRRAFGCGLCWAGLVERGDAGRGQLASAVLVAGPPRPRPPRRRLRGASEELLPPSSAGADSADAEAFDGAESPASGVPLRVRRRGPVRAGRAVRSGRSAGSLRGPRSPRSPRPQSRPESRPESRPPRGPWERLLRALPVSPTSSSSSADSPARVR